MDRSHAELYFLLDSYFVLFCLSFFSLYVILKYFTAFENSLRGLLFIKQILACLLLLTHVFVFSGCGTKVNLDDALKPGQTSTARVQSGDILVLSGGIVASTATPFPLHQIVAYDSLGNFKSVIYRPTSGSFIYGMALSLDSKSLFISVDTVDRIERLYLDSFLNVPYILDATNLTGATMRSVEILSDGSILAAESTTSIEKYNSALTRVTTNFPNTVVNTITSIRRISNDRFIASGTLGTDNPRVYNNAGVLQVTVPASGSTGCAANCDPADMMELADGRYVALHQVAAAPAIELFNSTFGYVGRAYNNPNVLRTPSTVAQRANGNLIVCDTTYNTCEEFVFTGTTLVRVGTSALISDPANMRQPLKVIVVP